jgi:hypothetical protein
LVNSASRFYKQLLSLLACCVLVFLSSASVSAQSQAITPQTSRPQAKPSVLIASLPVEGARDDGVRKVLASVMRFQLERLGTQSLLYATTDEEALVRDLLGGAEPDPDLLVTSLLELFSGLNHDFLALAGYIKEKEEIQVSFYIADLGRGEILASASRRAPIDFALDEAMIGTFQDMLRRAQGRIQEVSRRKAEEAAQVAEAAGEGQETGEEVRRGGDAITPEPLPLPEQRIGEGRAAEERFRHFEFSIGFAPFVPIGVAEEVFSLSYAPFVYGNYRIPLSVGILGVGVCTGLNIFDSEEAGLASYFHYVVPVGIDVRYTSAERSRLGLFARADLGVAINVSDFGSLPAIAQEGLSRFLVYGSGGVGAMFAFSRSVGIATDVMYETFVYFYEEESGGGIRTDWIMGFVPSIYLYTRL